VRITVIGAAGGAGRLVVAQGLARGHEVVALVRHAGELAGPPPTAVVAGDARSDDTLKQALEGSDATISVLSIPAGD
jgi:putative NADH-flavin reductase